MSKPIQTAGLTSLQQLILNEPDQRFILWIIANDDKAFSSYFLVELGKQHQLLQPNAAPNLAKAMVIFQNLLKKGMVDTSNPLKTTITWRGQFYRFQTHPYFQSYIGIGGTIIGIAGILFATGLLKFQCNRVTSNQSSNQPETIAKDTTKSILPDDTASLQIVGVTLDSVSLNRNVQNDTDTILKPDSTKHK